MSFVLKCFYAGSVLEVGGRVRVRDGVGFRVRDRVGIRDWI